MAVILSSCYRERTEDNTPALRVRRRRSVISPPRQAPDRRSDWIAFRGGLSVTTEPQNS